MTYRLTLISAVQQRLGAGCVGVLHRLKGRHSPGQRLARAGWAWALGSCEKVPAGPGSCSGGCGPSAAGAPTCATPATALDGRGTCDGAPSQQDTMSDCVAATRRCLSVAAFQTQLGNESSFQNASMLC